MSVAFNHKRGLIVLPCRVWRSARSAVFRLALDTGATTTCINTGVLVFLGYDPKSSSRRIQATTGSGVEHAPQIVVDQIQALGITQKQLPVLCLKLPPSAGVDGVLGLDFLRNRELVINFRRGLVSLS